ncbi:hypothetical protein niasHT_004358 [Heterodera trifolii]|uniref:Ubiquitin-like domain-containing protein n=1 Tax=Heterodera trifolii TaxID=157864 RepID=A0ABD2MBC3_9BILA
MMDKQSVIIRLKTMTPFTCPLVNFKLVLSNLKKNEVKTYSVWVNKEETVAILKKKIENESGIEPEKITLQYGQNDDYDVLNDGQTIGDYPIKNDDTVHLSIGEFTIVVRHEKKKENYTIWMNNKETVEILKKKIRNEGGIEPEKITLQYGQNDDYDVLNDAKTIGNYSIKKDDTIRLSIGESKIVVLQYKTNNEEKIFNAWVKSKETVAIFKRKIKNENGIEPDDQILRCTKYGPFLEDKTTLETCDIENNPFIYVFIKFEITVTADGHIFKKRLPITDTITVKVNQMDKVKDLKERIKNESGIEPKLQKLELKKPDGTLKVLDDTKTMKYYDIEEGTTVLLLIYFEITVEADKKFANGEKQIKVDVYGRDKVEDLKKKIIGKMTENFKTEIGTVTKRLTLKYGKYGDILNDGTTINDYPIEKITKVHLSIGEFYILVLQYQTNNEEKKFPVWVKSKETVARLKKKISYESAVEPKEQKLKVKSDKGDDGTLIVLEDERKLNDYGIKNDIKEIIGIKNDIKEIILTTQFKIKVTTEENILKKMLPIKIEVNGRDKVEELKTNIMKALEEKSKTKIGIELKKISLQHGSNDAYDVLENGNTIDYYPIKKMIPFACPLVNLKLLSDMKN